MDRFLPRWLHSIPLPWQKPTQTHWQQHNAYRRQKTRRSKLLRLDSPLWPVMLLLLVLSVTGCATNSPPPPSACPVLPAVPSVTTPQPSTTYSDSVRQHLSNWRAKLTATPLTP